MYFLFHNATVIGFGSKDKALWVNICRVQFKKLFGKIGYSATKLFLVGIVYPFSLKDLYTSKVKHMKKQANKAIHKRLIQTKAQVEMVFQQLLAVPASENLENGIYNCLFSTTDLLLIKRRSIKWLMKQ